MQLVEQGLLTLDTPVMPSLGITDTKISDEATVYHCLTHTSGIADDADDEAGKDYSLLFVDEPNCSIRNTPSFLPQFAWKNPIFAPGEGTRYNNCAYVPLRLVIEKIRGHTYRDHIHRNICAPAGMAGADFPSMDAAAPNVARMASTPVSPAISTTSLPATRRLSCSPLRIVMSGHCMMIS